MADPGENPHQLKLIQRPGDPVTDESTSLAPPAVPPRRRNAGRRVIESTAEPAAPEACDFHAREDEGPTQVEIATSLGIIPQEPDVVELEFLRDHADRLDQEIDIRLIKLGSELATHYLAVGNRLAEIKASKGYKLLGFGTWESYLDSKRHFFNRTYFSYLLKLGNSGLSPDAFDVPMSGTQLIEYTKQTDYPAMIPVLIKATWKNVSGLPTRKLGQQLKEFVAERAEEYRKRPLDLQVSRKRRLSHRKAMERRFLPMVAAERRVYLDDLRQFLEDAEAGLFD